MNLEVDAAEEYWQAVTVIEAQELIEQLKLHVAPNLKERDFKQYSERLHKLAYPKKLAATGPELTADELAKRIGDVLGKR